MNPEMMKGQIRSVLIGVGGIMAGWFASKGYISTDQVSAILNSPVFLSVATMAAGFIWSAITHTEKYAAGVVVEIAKDPNSPVRGVITENTVAGHELAKSIDGPIAPAGTVAADKITRT